MMGMTYIFENHAIFFIKSHIRTIFVPTFFLVNDMVNNMVLGSIPIIGIMFFKHPSYFFFIPLVFKVVLHIWRDIDIETECYYLLNQKSA